MYRKRGNNYIGTCCLDLENWNWKATFTEKVSSAKLRTKKAKIDAESVSVRKETHIACGDGAVVAKNVLLFLRSE